MALSQLGHGLYQRVNRAGGRQAGQQSVEDIPLPLGAPEVKQAMDLRLFATVLHGFKVILSSDLLRCASIWNWKHWKTMRSLRVSESFNMNSMT